MRLKIGVCGDPHLSATPPASRKDDYAQAVLGKLRWIARQSRERAWDACIIAGDLFHNKRIGFDLLHDLTDVLRDFPDPPFVLPGNHDMYYERLDLMRRTPLGYLYQIGLVMPMEGAVLGGAVVGVPYGQHRVFDRPAPYPGSLCVCHAFLGEHTDAEYWSFSEIRKLGYSVVFAGHDHSPHGITTESTPFGDLLVCRPGAVTRVTSSVVDRHLQPAVAELSLDIDGGCGVVLHDIPVAPASEVFSEMEQEVKDMATRVAAFAEELEGGLHLVEESRGSMQGMLESLGAPEVVVKRLLRYMIDMGVSVGAR